MISGNAVGTYPVYVTPQTASILPVTIITPIHNVYRDQAPVTIIITQRNLPHGCCETCIASCFCRLPGQCCDPEITWCGPNGLNNGPGGCFGRTGFLSCCGPYGCRAEGGLGQCWTPRGMSCCGTQGGPAGMCSATSCRCGLDMRQNFSGGICGSCCGPTIGYPINGPEVGIGGGGGSVYDPRFVYEPRGAFPPQPGCGFLCC